MEDSLRSSLDHQLRDGETRKSDSPGSPAQCGFSLPYSASAGLVPTMRKRFSRVNMLSLKLTLRLMLSTLFNTMKKYGIG